MDEAGPGLLLLSSSPPRPMTPPVLTALALLALSPALPAQCLTPFLPDDDARTDPAITRIADAFEILRGPFSPPLPSADSVHLDPDLLVYCDHNPLAPAHPFRPLQSGSAVPLEEPAEQPPSAVVIPESPATPQGLLVSCAHAGPGGVITAGLPVRTELLPPAAEQVPEPSAVLLIIGAAAWILLKRRI